MDTPRTDEIERRRVSAPSRRIVVVAGLGLALLAFLVPAAAFGCVLIFVALLLAIYWPQARRIERHRTAPPEPRNAVWPGRGMKAIVESLMEPAFVIDRQMMLRYRNPASSALFGNMALGDPISLRLRSPELLLAIEDVVVDLRPARSSFEERRPIERHWQVEIDPISVHQGETPRFFLLVFRDRTAEMRIETMRTDFVANASHELRTPLASLTGFIETLQGSARDDPRARDQFLAIMREQASRMSRLIDDLLSLSRVEMKRHVPPTEHTDMQTVFAKVRSQLAPLASDLDMVIDLIKPDGPMVILGDEDELIQVFANLVENACKYAESGKRVEMRLEWRVQDGLDLVEASVRDFGEGISEEHVPRLTERFYRVDTGASRAKRGTGLGLSISRNILLRHRSRLDVSSKLGEGSVFTALFPTPSAKNRKPSEIAGTSSS